jgi:hypothetical protein
MARQHTFRHTDEFIIVNVQTEVGVEQALHVALFGATVRRAPPGIIMRGTLATTRPGGSNPQAGEAVTVVAKKSSLQTNRLTIPGASSACMGVYNEAAGRTSVPDPHVALCLEDTFRASGVIPVIVFVLGRPL